MTKKWIRIKEEMFAAPPRSRHQFLPNNIHSTFSAITAPLAALNISPLIASNYKQFQRRSSRKLESNKSRPTHQSHIHNDTHNHISGSTEDVVSTGRSDKERLVPNRGMASDTWGKVSATRFRNTVNESKMVTPVTEHILNTAMADRLSIKVADRKT